MLENNSTLHVKYSQAFIFRTKMWDFVEEKSFDLAEALQPDLSRQFGGFGGVRFRNFQLSYLLLKQHNITLAANRGDFNAARRSDPPARWPTS